MRSTSSNLNFLWAALAGLSSIGCPSGGVGDPCIPEDEYRAEFAGFSSGEVNVESKSFQCETRVCLAVYFQGRVSCPYGNPEGEGTGDICYIPGTDTKITAPVSPQYVSRPREKSVYCSCRCSGPDKNARYCECPSGYACSNVVPDYGKGNAQLSGGYCIKEGTLPQGGPDGIPSVPCVITNGVPSAGCPKDPHPDI